MNLDWQQPQRQSAFGIFMFAGKAMREIVALLVVTAGSYMRSDKPNLSFWWIILGIGVYVFGRAFLQYYFFTFHIEEGQLVIKKGIFSKKTLIIPFERIQTVQLQQNLLHKIIGHCKLAIDSAGTETTEVSIQSIAYKKALSLKQALTEDVSAASEAVVHDNASVITLSPADLLKIAISANHFKTFALIIAFVIARFQDVKDLFDIDAYDWVESQGKQVAFTMQMFAVMGFFAIGIAILVSVIRIVLKFADLKIHLTQKGFHLKYGMLQSQQQFIGAKKIQYIKWNATWLRRKMGMFMFHLKTTGEDELKKKQQIHVPVTRKEHIAKLGSYYQPEIPSSFVSPASIHGAYIARKIMLVGLPVVSVAIAVSCIWWGWHSAWLLLWLVYYSIITIIYKSNFKIWANDQSIEIENGVWGRERSVINWNNIQVITIQQSIYQRRKKLATLELNTASGTVSVPYIRLEEAQLLSDIATMKIESSQQNWM